MLTGFIRYSFYHTTKHLLVHLKHLTLVPTNKGITRKFRRSFYICVRRSFSIKLALDRLKISPQRGLNYGHDKKLC